MTRTDNWTKFRKHNSLPDEITNYIISYILSEGVVIKYMYMGTFGPLMHQMMLEPVPSFWRMEVKAGS